MAILKIINRFNTAEIGAMSRDIPHEAKVLVKRMTSDSRVKIKEHWKVSWINENLDLQQLYNSHDSYIILLWLI